MKFLPLLILSLCLLINTTAIHAQGCVAVRQMGGVNTLCGGTASNSYNLGKGEFQVGASYRYFHSWRHFVGTEEQHERQTTGGGIGPDGKDRGNAVNIYSHAVDLNLSYGLSDRFQLNASIPWVHNERSQVLRSTIIDTTRYSVYAKGLGDVRLSANYWVFNPEKAQKGNLMLGLGLKLNTGSHSETDEALQVDGSKLSAVMDQAIQPGDGGIGISVELQGFKQLYKNLYGFANGYYLFNPKENNGTFKSPPRKGTGRVRTVCLPRSVFCPRRFYGFCWQGQEPDLFFGGPLGRYSCL